MTSCSIRTSNHEESSNGTLVGQKGSHLPELDGLRGFAILIVTLYRFGRDFPVDSWLGKSISEVVHAGTRGVELFFVLSGFLITGILLDSRNEKNYFGIFIARRALRIFPLYFISLLLFLVVMPRFVDLPSAFQAAIDNQFYLWTYLSNVKMVMEDAWCFGPLDHFWSLAVEEHFYLLWPLVVLFLPHQKSLRIILGLAVVSAVARIAICALNFNSLAPSVLTPLRCDALLLGAAIAAAQRSESGLQNWRRWCLLALPAFVLLGIAVDGNGRRLLTLGETIWPLAWGTLLVLLLTSKKEAWLATIFRLRILQTFGKFSYAMYVFQSPLLALTAPLGIAAWLSTQVGSNILGHCMGMAILLAATFGIALLSWHLVERHFLALKKYFPSHPNSASKAPHTNAMPILEKQA